MDASRRRTLGSRLERSPLDCCVVLVFEKYKKRCLFPRETCSNCPPTTEATLSPCQLHSATSHSFILPDRKGILEHQVSSQIGQVSARVFLISWCSLSCEKNRRHSELSRDGGPCCTARQGLSLPTFRSSPRSLFLCPATTTQHEHEPKGRRHSLTSPLPSPHAHPIAPLLNSPSPYICLHLALPLSFVHLGDLLSWIACQQVPPTLAAPLTIFAPRLSWPHFWLPRCIQLMAKRSSLPRNFLSFRLQLHGIPRSNL